MTEHQQLFEPTQLVRSLYLSERLGKNVFLKMDCQLPSGSFKIRGMSYLVQESIKHGKTNFVASSGGNAGIAATYACSQFNVPIHVYLPGYTADSVVAKLKLIYPDESKLTVTKIGNNWNEADAEARKKADLDKNCKYINPFDDPLLWEGHASVITELQGQLLRFGVAQPDLVVCSVGGGGLYNGIRLGLRKSYGQELGDQIPVLAIETKGCDSLFQAVNTQNKDFRLEAITSKATHSAQNL